MILVEKPEGMRPLGRPTIDWRILLKWVFKGGDGGVGCIDMAEDNDRWRALVNALMNFRAA
jgi:hypothetical protein